MLSDINELTAVYELRRQRVRIALSRERERERVESVVKRVAN